MMKDIINVILEKDKTKDLREKLYRIALLVCVAVSFYSIIGNIIGGFPAYINIKWGILLLISCFNLLFLKKREF